MTVISKAESPQTIAYGRLSKTHHLYKMPVDLSYLYSSSPPLQQVFDQCKSGFEIGPPKVVPQYCRVDAVSFGKRSILRRSPLSENFVMPKSCLKALHQNPPPTLLKNKSEIFDEQKMNESDFQSNNCRMRRIKSDLGSKRVGEKKVTFADAHGYELTFVKYMTETSLEPPKWDILDSMVRDLKLSATSKHYETVPSSEKPKLVAEFQQPVADYVNFKERLKKSNVCLENIILKELVSINGTVKVRNISFEKKVTVRITFDNWKTHSDHDASYVKNAYGNEEFDTFQFNIAVPKTFNPRKEKSVFCVRYETNAEEFWDNNNGSNYIISSNVSGSSEQSTENSDRRKKRCDMPNTYCELPTPQFNTWLEWENSGPFY